MAVRKARRESVDAQDFELNLTPGPVKTAAARAAAIGENLWMVPVEQIERIAGFNLRVTDRPEYVRHIEALADSITREGFYHDKPLAAFVSRDDDGATHFKLIDGYSRLAAVDLLRERGVAIERLPVAVKPAGTSMEDLTVALDRSNTGLPLTPYEKAILCQRLIKMGNSLDVVASRLGYTEKYVQDLLDVLSLPSGVLLMVRNGEVPATVAVRQSRKHGSRAVGIINTALDKAKAAGKSRMTERFIPKELKSSVRPKPAPLRAVPTIAPSLRKNVARDSDFYRSAIEYAVAELKGASSTVSWLKDFMAGDPSAIADLETFMHQKPGSLADPDLRGPLRPNGAKRLNTRPDYENDDDL